MMNDATISRLNAINQRFYQITANAFDQTRARPWAGWTRLLTLLKPPLSVLDVACGNGRFGQFLYENLGPNVTYYGLDSNPVLLERARATLQDHDVRLELRDVLTAPLEPEATSDLVALFGMLHHIPGHENRRQFLKHLADQVAPGGLLVFSAWCFWEYQRFRRRIVDWPDGFAIEAGDYLLDWQRGPRALRYCHYVDDAEHAELVSATGLSEIDTYRADGESGDMNRYSILRKKA